MAQRKSSLIFIPDITGFSAFVKETEVSHSEHIISELLEIIIASNQIGMEVSEVEGDAVLFFKENEVPSLEECIKQFEKTFIDFQAHLLQYEKYRICTCGACSIASKLNLKFIVHSGEIGFITIQGRRKPHGHEIVVPHRLLKNNIKHPSYVLFSDSISAMYELKEGWIKGESIYDDLGKREYYFKDLDYLWPRVPEPKSFIPPDRIDNPIKAGVFINDDLDNLVEYVANFEFRSLWQDGVDRFEYNKNEVNRIGTQHICVINNNHFQFETVAKELKQDHRVIGERNNNPPLFKELVTYYIFDRKAEGVQVNVEIHFFHKNILSRLLGFFIEMILSRSLHKNLKNLKKFAEKKM